MTVILRREHPDVFNLHSHSRFSVNDALPSVSSMVKTITALHQPALGLTDHGNMAGTVQLYQECAKEGIAPFPGTEIYIVRDRADKKAKRHHMCIVAYTSRGYENLVNLSTLSHKNFYHKPLLDFADLATLSDQGLLAGLAGTSGCYFGFIMQAIAGENFDEAEALLLTYNKWFTSSDGMFFAEFQNHNIDHGNGVTDAHLVNDLHALAYRHGIPAVLTQDSHYCHQDDKSVHESLKRLVSYGPDPDDAVFPGDGFHLADTQWLLDHHTPAIFDYGYQGFSWLLDNHDLRIKELDNYSYNIPFTVDDPDGVLREKTITALVAAGLDKEVYFDRLEEELEIVRETGMAGYLLMVQEVVEWFIDSDILYQARGSASGSLLCYLLKITQLDPIKWGIPFDRFLSRDRRKPPDIDLDIEHHRRHEALEWLKTRFEVQFIGTWGVHSIAGDEEGKGSLRVKYLAAIRRQGGDPVWADTSAEDRESLAQIARHTPYSHYGTHAAGLVMTTTAEELARLVPLMWSASADAMTTQYPMKDIEALGLVKLDLLGVKTLSVIHKCLSNLGRDFRDGLDWIPFTNDQTYRAIGHGHTDGVFQLEGWTSRRGCRDLKPTKITDVVAAMALFRPATMSSGATASYIKRKHKQEELPHRHALIHKETKDTYGIMLYQEQVIGILRGLGMQPDDLTLFLKAVKSSNDNVEWAQGIIERYRPWVEDAAYEMGFTQTDWIWLWNAIEGFGEYGFNLAHSAVYGVTAYRTAYLSTNHTVEFFAALLNVFAGSAKQGRDKVSKEEVYIKAARERGIRIMSAHINESGVSYEVASGRRGIRRGLMGVKGIGQKTAEHLIERRPPGGYSSLEEMCRLVDRRKITGAKAYLEDGAKDVGIIKILEDHGALDFDL